MFLTNFSKKTKKLYPQALAACAVFIIAIQVGILCVWSSPYLAKLTAPDSPLPLTLDEASWVASLLYLGRIPGALIGSTSVNFYGSKKSTMLTALPLSIGWILMIAASSPIWLYAARFTLGVGFGFAYSCFFLYLGEVVAPEIRGSLVSFAVQGMPVGDLLASVLGSNMSLRASSIACFIPCALVAILLSLLPDSPHHLVKIGDIEGARKSIQWYRGSDKVDEELDEVTYFVKATTAESFMDKLAEFKLRHVRKATCMVVTLFALMQLSGLSNMFFYMQIIIKRSGSTVMEPSSVVTYVLVSSVLIGISTISLYDKCGRRLLLIVSCFGVSISLVALGTHFVLQERNFIWIGSQWLPIASLFTFIFFFTIGLNSVPSIVSSEVYSANIKSVAACIVNLVAAALAFSTSKAYQPLVDLFGEAYVFYGHGVFTMLGVPYAILFMPETKGKSLQQIQTDLMKKK